jgi:alcohol dehydrogenase class IV
MRFDFATAARIMFGPGAVAEVAPAAREMGRRALVVTGRTPGRASVLIGALESAVPFPVAGEPTIDQVREGTEVARRESCDMLVAFGGGSAIDAGKAIAALLANGGDPLDYLEVVGWGQRLSRPSAPLLAVPTTAGSGSEVTRNAVLASPEHRLKASLRSPYLLPRLAAVDPELTLGLPPEITASTGLDALTQLIEPYVSVRANAMTDMFCAEGMRRVAGSLARAFVDGGDLQARTDMSLASLLGGLALANAGLGAVHGFAAAVGGRFEAPHGAICAALLPHVMAVNVRALGSRDAGGEALRRYHVIARTLTGKRTAEAGDGVAWVSELCAQLRVRPLGAYGIAVEDVPELVANAARASSMKGNPIALSEEELREILTAAL